MTKKESEEIKELAPCYHEAETIYMVCDSCIRKWNGNFKRMIEMLSEAEKKAQVLVEALEKIASGEQHHCIGYDACLCHEDFAKELLSKFKETDKVGTES